MVACPQRDVRAGRKPRVAGGPTGQTPRVLEQPIATQPHYGEHLGDAAYWGPYVAEAARRERIPVTHAEAAFVGTFPTFLIGDHVVKLFGPAFDGLHAWAAERSMHKALAARPDLPVPALVAAGALFDASHTWRWPYLVTRRLHGHTVRDVGWPDRRDCRSLDSWARPSPSCTPFRRRTRSRVAT
jgi:hypothetical protein